jgi:hypothetical protein
MSEMAMLRQPPNRLRSWQPCSVLSGGWATLFIQSIMMTFAWFAPSATALP